MELQSPDSYFLYCTAWYRYSGTVSYTVHVRGYTARTGILLPRISLSCRGGGGRRGRRGGRYRRAKLKARQSSVMVTAVAHSQPDSE